MNRLFVGYSELHVTSPLGRMARSGSWGGVNESDEDERRAVLQVQNQNLYTRIDVVNGQEEETRPPENNTSHPSRQVNKSCIKYLLLPCHDLLLSL